MAKIPPPNPLIVVLGATGTGKSQLAIDLAVRYNGEIINGDAMQMYAGFPIITNKITDEEQKGIPHHLLGVVGLDEETWRVGVFKRNAGRIIREIRERGKLPILVGGTHYYTQSLLLENELVEDPQKPDLSPEEISNKFPILDASTEEILEKLREVDPRMADRWHPKDTRHIRRSLEIYLTTGKQASQIYDEQKQKKKEESEELKSLDESFFSDSWNTPQLLPSTLFFWVHAEDAILKARLNARVDTMMELGLLDEVKTMDRYLLEQESNGTIVDKSRGIWVSIGYKEFQPYLATTRKDEVTEKELKMAFQDSLEQTKAATRRYAKRQVAWIRRKLIASLLDAKAVGNLYLLDGSVISQWNDTVSNPAIRITGDFLDGSGLPNPKSLSQAAQELLNPVEPEKINGQAGVQFRKECTLCHSTFIIERHWMLHMNSRTHRRMVQKSVRRDAANTPEAQAKREARKLAAAPKDRTTRDADRHFITLAAEPHNLSQGR